MITIDSGIIVFMRDGRIVNFPNGNDDEYQVWCKTDDSKQVVLFMCDKECVARNVFRGGDAEYFIDEAIMHFRLEGLDTLIENMHDFYDDLDDNDIGDIGKNVLTRLFDTESQDYLDMLAKHRSEDNENFQKKLSLYEDD